MRDRFVKKYRYSWILLKELVRTGFKLRYQGSALGYLWSLFKPLFMFIILYFVFVHFLRIGGDVPNWPISMLFGIVLWNFFSEVTSTGLSSVVGRSDVIRKINFPKYIIVLSSSVLALINLLLNFIVLAVFMAIGHVSIGWSALLSPLYIFELFLFAMGISFILAPLYVRLRDIGYIWEIVSQALFYGSAVIYPISMVVSQNVVLAKLLLLNPITQSVQGARNALIGSSNIVASDLTSNIFYTLTPILLVAIIFIIGAWLFKKRSPDFAEDI
ncbi:MAG: ABC transporter permease [Candidatus Nomurabacteria bacterium]|jgi:ABC-2 type transport system permease protein|nr:ABC transporter permease [Candidatus Nomurabacteria bacterium]